MIFSVSRWPLRFGGSVAHLPEWLLRLPGYRFLVKKKYSGMPARMIAVPTRVRFRSV